MMRILFIGESWQGSNARSMREALALQPGVIVSDIAEDHFLPNHHGLPLRIANRLLRLLQMKELKSVVLRTMNCFRPDVIVVYNGAGIGTDHLEEFRRSGIPVINLFPDCLARSYGHQQAMGCYDLVISTKPFHPQIWKTVYSYPNSCVCVPHGYDPEIHYWPDPAPMHSYDVAMCSTWRPEYHLLMRSFANELGCDRISLAIAGSGWKDHRYQLPRHWQYVGLITGRAYGEFLRSAKIAIAPVQRKWMYRGVNYPGDEDTARTYELAAAQCFFLHQRTDYVATVYDEQTEVPLWSDAIELANLVRRWLPDEAGRQLMAARAHSRAVPAYSITQRAKSVMMHIDQLIKVRNASSVVNA